MKYTKYILSLMFLASLNGCIKEDMSDCPGNCTLKFSYVGDGTTQIFQDKIHKVDMYVFDSDGMLLSSHPISEADVKKQSTELNLPVGDYQIVTVGNTYNTEVSGEQNLATAQFCAFMANGLREMILYIMLTRKSASPVMQNRQKKKWILPVRITKSM